VQVTPISEETAFLTMLMPVRLLRLSLDQIEADGLGIR
jgi:hypothetical protein